MSMCVCVKIHLMKKHYISRKLMEPIRRAAMGRHTSKHNGASTYLSTKLRLPAIQNIANETMPRNAGNPADVCCSRRNKRFVVFMAV